jgi:hypothetical protein
MPEKLSKIYFRDDGVSAGRRSTCLQTLHRDNSTTRSRRPLAAGRQAQRCHDGGNRNDRDDRKRQRATVDEQPDQFPQR